MADGYIQVPPDSTGKRLDAESLTVSGLTVHRERDQISGRADTEIADVRNSDPALSDHGLVTRAIDVVEPITDTLSSSSLSAGSSVDLNGTLIASGKIGKVMGLSVASTVPCKWELKKVDGASEITLAWIVTSPSNLTESHRPPSKEFMKQAHVSGDERFRITVTNLDGRNAANVYATLCWDQVG